MFRHDMGWPSANGRLWSRACSAMVIALWSLLAPRSPSARPIDNGFVYVEDGSLKLNGGAFYFSGANSFSLLYSEIDAQAQFDIASSLGLNAVRLWGFWNGAANTSAEGTAAAPDTDGFGHYVLQPAPRVYPEPAWRRLDYVVLLAHAHGIKLIIPLLNQWPEFGGIDTYLEWVGMKVPPKGKRHYEREGTVKQTRSAFWTHSEAKAIFFDYIRHLLTRVNVYTGVAYKDDPAIMIWEVMNEPRYGPWNGDPTGRTVRNFIAETAAFIKSIDPNHLVGTGEEGFLNAEDTAVERKTYPWVAAQGEGVSFSLNAQIPHIDVLGVHCWPFQWGLWESSGEDFNDDMVGEYPNIAEFGPEWIREHAKIARSVGKPLYLGEFGLQILRVPGSDISDRDHVMRAVYDAAREENLAGVAFWHLTSEPDPQQATYTGPMDRETLLQGQYDDDALPHDLEFRFDIFCPADATTCALINDYSKVTTQRVEHPDPPFQTPCLEPWTRCGDDCVLTASHPEHCGRCGAICAETAFCANGRCRDLSERGRSLESHPSDDATAPAGCTAAPVGSGHAGISLKWLSDLLQMSSDR